MKEGNYLILHAVTCIAFICMMIISCETQKLHISKDISLKGSEQIKQLMEIK